jgi:amino acid permease
MLDPKPSGIYGTMKHQQEFASEDGQLAESDSLKKQLNPATKKVSAQEMTVNLIAGGLGAGIFSLPWSMAGASVIPSVAIIAAVLVVNAWTIMILVEAAELKKTFDLGGLLSHLPGHLGPAMQVFFNALVWASGFMCLVSYFIIVADSIAPFSAGTLLASRHVVVGLIAVVVLPLSFLNQKDMSWTSTLVVVVNVYIFMLLARLHETDPHPSDLCMLGFSTGNIAMVSAMMQAVIIQMCVLPMYGELEDRSPRKFQGVLTNAFGALFLIFAGFSVLAYLTFGPDVHGNVLIDLPNTILGNVARAAASASVLGCWPLLLMPMLAPVQNAEMFKSEGSQKQTAITVTTVVLIGAVMVVAFFVRDLGIMNVVNGAMCVGGIVAACPAMVGLYLVEREQRVMWQFTMVALLVFGMGMSVLGLMYTDNYASALKGHCLWPL